MNQSVQKSHEAHVRPFARLAQRWSHRPLVQATAAALAAMSAGHVHASCGPSTDPVSITTIITYTVSSGCPIDVSGANAITTSSEGNPVTIVNNDRVTSSAVAAYFGAVGGGGNTVFNSGTMLGATRSVDRSGPTIAINVFNNDSGQLVGGINATDLTNHTGGVVTLKSNVSLSDIRNTGGVATATLTGAFTGESGSTLRIAIASPSSYSYLTAATTSVAGSTLDVDVKAGSGVANGDLFYVVRSSGHTGFFGQVTDNSALLNFEQNITEGGGEGAGISLRALRVLSVTQAATDNNNNPGLPAARVLDDIIDTGTTNTDMQQVITALNGLSTARDVSNAASQAGPLLTGGMPQVASNVLHGINRIVQARIESNRGLSSGDLFTGDRKVWLKPFGSWADQKDVKAVAGYKANTGGFALGFDGETSKAHRLGVGIAYGNTAVNGNSLIARQNAKVDTYQAIIYGSYALDDRTEVNYQLDGGINTNKGTRQIAFVGRTASSDYNSTTAHAGIGIGRVMDLSERTTFTPSLRADHSWIRDEAYLETGAGALNLNVRQRDAGEFIVSGDGKWAYKVDDHTTLTANVGAGYDAMAKRSSIIASFVGGGAAFNTIGFEPSKWIYRAGAGMVMNQASRTEVTARYDVEHRDGFYNQTASVKLRWAF